MSTPSALVSPAVSLDLLMPHHLTMLRHESSIADEVIIERGYRSLDATESYGVLLHECGFSKSQAKVGAGLPLPLHRTDGKRGLTIYRPDQPRPGRDGRLQKYLIPQGATSQIDCPPRCQALLTEPTVPIWITEGQKKADALASRGAVALALLGIWNFIGKNAQGTRTILVDFDYVGWDTREVYIVYDNDLMFKSSVHAALDRLTAHMERKGATVLVVYLPMNGGVKMGVDDYFAAGHSLTDLEGRIEAPHPQPKPQPSQVELLNDAPLTISRPLSLVAGHAYAAVWPHVRVTRKEALDKQGHVITLATPDVTTEQRLFIVRDDGVIFGEGGDQPMSELGIDVHLPDIPPWDKLWTTPGFRAYRAGGRPDPVEVFHQVVAVVDRFIDFNRSLGSQETMCELVACYILATWFLDTFTVMGYLWANGDRGSGKTQLLTVIAELGYLGHVLLSGGSLAALRDLADYGATLCFDDAERVMDVKHGDPDKRALLLAGNRKGNTLAVKEPVNGREWRTRYAQTFCPRLFSAIRLPDPVLASRTIIVPLIRTANREKANADPLEYALWPTLRAQLVESLWSVALQYRATMPAYYTASGTLTTALLGRNLEPWRALFAVAAWLTACGVADLDHRIEALALNYQGERATLEPADLTALTIIALCRHITDCASSASSASSASKKWTWGEEEEKKIVTAEIAAVAKALAEDQEDGIKPEAITTARIGRVLGKMRLRVQPRAGGKGKRTWLLSKDDLRSWLIAYGMTLPDELNDVFCRSHTQEVTGTSGTPLPTDGTHGAGELPSAAASPPPGGPAGPVQDDALCWCPSCRMTRQTRHQHGMIWRSACGATLVDVFEV